MRRLIINADDFGYNDGVVQGIVDMHQAGLVTSTTCMTNMPAWPQAAAYLRQQPGFGAGVHLVFNKSRPVLPVEQVPALVGQDGQFLNDGQILRSFRPGTTQQLRAEFRAQIERFIADVGRPPDHLDNHCVISYVRLDRFKVALELAEEYGLPIRSPFGDDLEEQASVLARLSHVPSWLVRWLGGQYRRRVDRAGIRRPNNLILNWTLLGPHTVENLLSALALTRHGWVSELMAHPGYDGDWREQDLRALQDPRVREWLAQPDVELVSFSALVG